MCWGGGRKDPTGQGGGEGCAAGKLGGGGVHIVQKYIRTAAGLRMTAAKQLEIRACAMASSRPIMQTRGQLTNYSRIL
jgi:hypothetical protein